MTLQNLLAIHKLAAHKPSQASIAKLLSAAARNIKDAKVTSISGENRFDAAYKAIMQCSMAALWANGFRTSTSQPGHHQIAIQALPKTIGLDSGTVIVLDALRKQRNLSDYEGDPISDGAVDACIENAIQLYERVTDWIKTNHPDLIKTN